MSELSFSTHNSAGITVIKVSGKLDGTGNEALDSFIKSARHAPDDLLVFDLSELEFLDSTGLRALLDAYSCAVRHGANVYFASLQDEPARLFSATGLDTVLPVHASVAEALHEASRPAA
ncbi:STAS domain-containing protein [Nonomuraea jiangxiensis]|uniref:Anti-sigma factor antagonist n=1 Tax=Nonomuraea jiangxiensis TaxID=633440 RepID=A0A1G8TV35_9ACTN|nr:STAS domain-containing protein [Nonomuraea jiangxiensis]SDJ44590.1 anti-sigma B factor antagonist [Nonomuraea jiangxiensis]